VRTKWDGDRLVSEIAVGDAKVIEIYARTTTGNLSIPGDVIRQYR
jgi:hypothetical protein